MIKSCSHVLTRQKLIAKYTLESISLAYIRFIRQASKFSSVVLNKLSFEAQRPAKALKCIYRNAARRKTISTVSSCYTVTPPSSRLSIAHRSHHAENPTHLAPSKERTNFPTLTKHQVVQEACPSRNRLWYTQYTPFAHEHW